MFGLGWMELLIIAGVISLFAGPGALRKLLQMAQQVQQVKSDFTGPGAIKRLLDSDLSDAPAPEDDFMDVDEPAHEEADVRVSDER